MSTLLDTVREFLEEEDWPYVMIEGQSGLAINFRGDNGTFHCYAGTREEDSIFFFHAFAPEECPLELRPAMTELLTRANYGMYLGAFEMDLEDGEMRFKNSVDVEGAALSEVMVRNVIYTSCAMLDRYYPAIDGLLHEGLSPQQALALAEGSPN